MIKNIHCFIQWIPAELRHIWQQHRMAAWFEARHNTSNIEHWTDKSRASENLSAQHVEGRRIDYSSIFIGTRRQPHRQNKLASTANCMLVRVTIATVSREPAPFERHTPTSYVRDALPTQCRQVTCSAQPHRCSNGTIPAATTLVDNSFQSTCFVHSRSHRPTTQETLKKKTLHTSKTNITRLWASLQRASFELRFVWFPCKTMHVGPSLFSAL